MRYLFVLTAFLLAFATGQQAYAQEKRPLYNSGGGGSPNLYNSGTVRPLSLRQIVEGRSSGAGSSGTAGAVRYSPYTGTSVRSFDSYAEIDAFRAQQAEQARQAEEEARQAFLSYNSPEQDQGRDERTQTYLNRFQGGATSTQTPVRQRVLYEDKRQETLQTPKRLFNSYQ